MSALQKWQSELHCKNCSNLERVNSEQFSLPRLDLLGTLNRQDGLTIITTSALRVEYATNSTVSFNDKNLKVRSHMLLDLIVMFR